MYKQIPVLAFSFIVAPSLAMESVTSKRFIQNYAYYRCCENALIATRVVIVTKLKLFMKDKTWTNHRRDITLVASSVAARWISMSKLNEREDRSMIAHARDECVRRVLFFSDIIYSRHYLESLALFLWRVL